MLKVTEVVVAEVIVESRGKGFLADFDNRQESRSWAHLTALEADTRVRVNLYSSIFIDIVSETQRPWGAGLRRRADPLWSALCPPPPSWDPDGSAGQFSAGANRAQGVRSQLK